jgi:hypothetical protein
MPQKPAALSVRYNLVWASNSSENRMWIGLALNVLHVLHRHKTSAKQDANRIMFSDLARQPMWHLRKQLLKT